MVRFIYHVEPEWEVPSHQPIHFFFKPIQFSLDALHFHSSLKNSSSTVAMSLIISLKLLLVLSFIGLVAADTGDDFINNLFSDLAP